MIERRALAWMAIPFACILSAPAWALPPGVTAPASAPLATPPVAPAVPVADTPPGARTDQPVIVTAKPRHRAMHFLFGRNRRRGGFFKNLFHPHGRRWRGRAGHNKACRQHYRSFSARTNTYKAYSGVRRVCLY